MKNIYKYSETQIILSRSLKIISRQKKHNLLPNPKTEKALECAYNCCEISNFNFLQRVNMKVIKVQDYL
jgi:hypothetical protein